MTQYILLLVYQLANSVTFLIYITYHNAHKTICLVGKSKNKMFGC